MNSFPSDSTFNDFEIIQHYLVYSSWRGLSYIFITVHHFRLGLMWSKVMIIYITYFDIDGDVKALKYFHVMSGKIYAMVFYANAMYWWCDPKS